MFDAARVEFGIEIGLVDQVFPPGKLPVSRQCDARFSRVDRTGEYVLIEFVIIGITGPVPDADRIAEIMFDQKSCCVGVCPSRAVAGIAKKLPPRRY